MHIHYQGDTEYKGLNMHIYYQVDTWYKGLNMHIHYQGDTGYKGLNMHIHYQDDTGYKGLNMHIHYGPLPGWQSIKVWICISIIINSRVTMNIFVLYLSYTLVTIKLKISYQILETMFWTLFFLFHLHFHDWY